MGLDEDIISALIGLLEGDRETFVPARFSILIYLFLTQRAQFTQLQKILKFTPGNLSSHLKKLESNELITIFKHFVDLKPTTLIEITQKGTQKVLSHIKRMRGLITAVVEKTPTSVKLEKVEK